MALRDGTAPASFPQASHAFAAIALITFVGIALAGAGVAIDFDGMEWLLVGAFALVGVAALIQTRLYVLPSIVKAYRTQTQPVSLPRTASSLKFMALAFSISPAIYGVISALFLAAWWAPLPFAALACITLAILHGYADQQIAMLRRESAMKGES